MKTVILHTDGRMTYHAIKLIVLALSILFSSCTPRAIGYQNNPIMPAYYPRYTNVHIGPVKLFEITWKR